MEICCIASYPKMACCMKVADNVGKMLCLKYRLKGKIIWEDTTLYIIKKFTMGAYFINILFVEYV